VLNLLAQTLELGSLEHIRHGGLLTLMEHYAGALHYLLRNFDQFAVFSGLPGLPFTAGHALDRLTAAFGGAVAVMEQADSPRNHFAQVFNQPGDDADRICQQGVVGGMMNLTLNDRSSYIMRMLSRR